MKVGSRGLLAAFGVMVVAACQDVAAPVGDTTVASLVPAGGASNVDPAAPIVIEFTHAMGSGMEQYAALHEGDVNGPIVQGTWSWSDDSLRLMFTPAAALKPGTPYAIHLGGGMRDAAGGLLNYEHCGTQHGGQWATQSMMGGSMMGGTLGMMGTGWRHANGTYGMVFYFTTA